MGIFGIKREDVGDIKRKRAVESLKRKKKEKELREKAEKAKAEAGYYKAKAEKKKAKRAAGFQWPILPTAKVKVKKKKQGKPLSRKKRIGLI